MPDKNDPKTTYCSRCDSKQEITEQVREGRTYLYCVKCGNEFGYKREPGFGAKKYCFSFTFENVSGGYLMADTWIEAIQEAQHIRNEKYPEMEKEFEEDIVEVKMVGDSVWKAR